MKYVYAKIKNPRLKKLKENIKDRYNKLYFEVTKKGKVPLRFKVINNNKLKYADILAYEVGMREVYVNKNSVKIINNEQLTLPIDIL